MNQSPALDARMVCQRLREAALGTHRLQVLGRQCETDPLRVDIEGWRLVLELDGGRLLHCQSCQAPGGRQWQLETRQRFGTDPVSLLSTWELARIEHLLETAG
ncbi:hypothetical protein H7A76_27100 [Pseudomonas sp. MSSRFD41]|uniref:DUF7693 family protein n=1 Tax=unclassified Pseudomonas TaxID=196821 RepID=UPI00163B5E6F|nr:hypothetical protein [Pseudomonas sp. MSSRFD41]MBC2659123.1 hypothetical protein [Pseudomonas sp. MSSRFD41]